MGEPREGGDTCGCGREGARRGCLCASHTLQQLLCSRLGPSLPRRRAQPLERLLVLDEGGLGEGPTRHPGDRISRCPWLGSSWEPGDTLTLEGAARLRLPLPELCRNAGQHLLSTPSPPARPDPASAPRGATASRKAKCLERGQSSGRASQLFQRGISAPDSQCCVSSIGLTSPGHPLPPCSYPGPVHQPGRDFQEPARAPRHRSTSPLWFL